MHINVRTIWIVRRNDDLLWTKILHLAQLDDGPLRRSHSYSDTPSHGGTEVL